MIRLRLSRRRRARWRQCPNTHSTLCLSLGLHHFPPFNPTNQINSPFSKSLDLHFSPPFSLSFAPFILQRLIDRGVVDRRRRWTITSAPAEAETLTLTLAIALELHVSLSAAKASLDDSLFRDFCVLKSGSSASPIRHPVYNLSRNPPLPTLSPVASSPTSKLTFAISLNSLKVSVVCWILF